MLCGRFGPELTMAPMDPSRWLLTLGVGLLGCSCGHTRAPSQGPDNRPIVHRPSGVAPVAPRSPFSGNFSSTRGPLSCTDGGASVSCTYGPGGVGRLNCVKEADGALLTCTFSVSAPVPESGHVLFTRSSPTDPRWQGQLFYDGP